MKLNILIAILGISLSGCTEVYQDEPHKKTNETSAIAEKETIRRLPFSKWCDSGRAVYITRSRHTYAGSSVHVIDNAPECRE